MEVLTGTRAKTQVFVDSLDRVYTKYRSTEGRTYLRCHSNNCKGRAVIEGDSYRILTAHDDHANHHSTIVILRFRQRLREKVEASPEKMPKAIFEETQLEDHEAAALVSFADVRNLIFTTRSQYSPPIPKDLQELGTFMDMEKYCIRYGTEIGPNHRKFYSGTTNSAAGETSVIFVSQAIVGQCQNRRIMCGMDATFKVVPRIGGAYQLFGIYLLEDGSAYPLLISLMERKTTASYVSVIQKFKELCEERHIIVESVITDYEAALKTALSRTMPATVQNGCYFHFARAVYVKYKASGLVRGNINRRPCIKMLMCLALLPAHLILDAIELVRAILPNDEQYQQFCTYMVRQWSTQNISVHGQTVRTNNSVESFHKYFYGTVGRAHPNVWNFLTKLLQVEHNKAVQLTRRRSGEEHPPQPRSANQLQDQRIKRAQATLAIDGDIEKFLRQMSRKAESLVAMFDPVDVEGVESIDDTLPYMHNETTTTTVSAGASESRQNATAFGSSSTVLAARSPVLYSDDDDFETLHTVHNTAASDRTSASGSSSVAFLDPGFGSSSSVLAEQSSVDHSVDDIESIQRQDDTLQTVHNTAAIRAVASAGASESRQNATAFGSSSTVLAARSPVFYSDDDDFETLHTVHNTAASDRASASESSSGIQAVTPRIPHFEAFNYDSDDDFGAIGTTIRNQLYGVDEADFQEDYLNSSSDESLCYAPVNYNITICSLVEPCIACSVSEAEYAFVDCGHMGICSGCVTHFEVLQSDAIENDHTTWQYKCPKCRKVIRHQPVRIFK